MQSKDILGFSGYGLRIILSILVVIFFSIAKIVWADDSGFSLDFEHEHSRGETYEFQLYDGDHVEVTGRIDVGSGYESSASFGPEGVELDAAAYIGIKAELEAISKEYTVGGEYVELSAQGQVKVEALLGAEGAVNAYIDKNGISIGAEARAGAYVSASAEATFGANIFGVQTDITIHGEVHAGALAQGTANVTIGFDGRVEFELGAGVAFGVGASVGMSFGIDASKLIEQLGLDNLVQLYEWMEVFIADPQKYIDDLIRQGLWQGVDYLRDRAHQLTDNVRDAVYDFVDTQKERIGRIPSFIKRGLDRIPIFGDGISHGDHRYEYGIRYGNWYGPKWSGGTEGGVIGNQPPVDSLDAIAMRHDFAYEVARQQGEIYGSREESRLRAIADAIAARDAANLDPNPLNWDLPPDDPDMANRYRERMELLFSNITPVFWDSYGRLQNISDWITAPLENYYLDYASNRLTPEQFELYVDALVKDWYRRNPDPEVREIPYKDFESPYKGFKSPYKGFESPYKGFRSPYRN